MEPEIQPKRYLFLRVKGPSLLTDRNQIQTVEAHARKRLCMEFRKYSCNGNRDKAEKVLCSPSKLRSVIDQSQPTYNLCRAKVSSARCTVTGKFLE